MQTSACPTQVFGLSTETRPASPDLPNRGVQPVAHDPEMEALFGLAPNRAGVDG